MLGLERGAESFSAGTLAFTIGKENFRSFQSGGGVLQYRKAQQVLLVRTALSLSNPELQPKLRQVLQSLESGQVAASTFVNSLEQAGLSPAEFCAQLPQGVGQGLLSLSTEPHALLFAQGLLRFIDSPSSSQGSGAALPLLKDLQDFAHGFLSSRESRGLLQQIEQNLSLYEGTASLGAQVKFGLRQLTAQFPNPAMMGGLALSMPLHALTRYALVSRGFGLWRANAVAFAVDGLAFTAGESAVHGLQGLHDPRAFGTRLWESYRMLGVMRFAGGAVGAAARTPWARHAMASSPLLRTSVSGALPHVSAFGGLSLSEMAFNGQSFGGSLLPSTLGVLHFAGAKGALHSLAPRMAWRTQQLEAATQQAALNGLSHVRTQVRAQLHTFASGGPISLGIGYFNKMALADGPAGPGAIPRPSRPTHASDWVMQMADEGGRDNFSTLPAPSRAPAGDSYPWPQGTLPKKVPPEQLARIEALVARLPDGFHRGREAVEAHLTPMERLLSQLRDPRLQSPDAVETIFITLANNASSGASRPSPKLYEGFMYNWEALDAMVGTWAVSGNANGAMHPRVEVLDTLLNLSNNFGSDYYAFGAGVPKVLGAWKKVYGVTPETREGWGIIRTSLLGWSAPARTHSSRFFDDVPQLLTIARNQNASPEQAVTWMQQAFPFWSQAARTGDLHPVSAAEAKIEELALAAVPEHPKTIIQKPARPWEPFGSGREEPGPIVRRRPKGPVALYEIKKGGGGKSNYMLNRAQAAARQDKLGRYGEQIDDRMALLALQHLRETEIADLMGITESWVAELREREGIILRTLSPDAREKVRVVLRELSFQPRPLGVAMRRLVSDGISITPFELTYFLQNSRISRGVSLDHLSPQAARRLVASLEGLTQPEMAEYLGVSLDVLRRFLPEERGSRRSNPIPHRIKDSVSQHADALTAREFHELLRIRLGGSQTATVRALGNRLALGSTAFLHAKARAPEATARVAPPLTLDVLARDLQRMTASYPPG